MPRLFVGNFELEWTLSGRAAVPPVAVLRAARELAPAWIAIAEDGDCIWTPEPVDEAFFAALKTHGLPDVRGVSIERDVPAGSSVCPWGWTEAIRDWARRYGWVVEAPVQQAVRQVNSRRFSFELESEWGVGLPGTSLIRDIGEVAGALRSLPADVTRWVMKAEYGMSARERLLGSGRELSAAASAWLRKRLDYGSVVLEPWVQRVDEAGLQFEIPQQGEPRLVGITPLLTDRSGVYRGSRFGADPLIEHQWADAVAVGRRAAARLQDIGYFGPVGFDAMCYRDPDGAIRVRPLQDINARWTMGRLALGFERLLAPGECGAWLHLPYAAKACDDPPWVETVRRLTGSGVRLIPTSPETVGGQLVQHRTRLLLAQDHESLLRAEFVCS